MMKTIVCATALVETSPQALPLGAACIASALSSCPDIKNEASVYLEAFSLEDIAAPDFSQAASFIAGQLLSRHRDMDFLLLSIYVWNRQVLEECAALIKKEKPSVIIIAGGCEVTANPLNFKNIDFSISGEGEDSSCQLLQKLLNIKDQALIGEDDFSIQGVYNLKKSYSSGSIRSLMPDVSKLPSPYLDGTLDPASYGGALWELARGCPFKCSYCYESKGEKKIQRFSRDRLLKELELFAKKNIAQVFVLDPTYNADKKMALDMLNQIKKTAPDIFFYFEARAEFIDRELSRAFSKVNCALQFGLQSSNPEVLKKVNRTFNKEKFVKNIAFLNQDGVIFGFDLIYGLPGDNLSGFKKSVDFAIRLYPNNLEMFCLSVLPGTDLADSAKDLGLVWQSQAPYHVIQSSGFSKEDLAQASSFSFAADLFYNKGRAVPWFMSMINYLHVKPSVFFEDFENWLKNNEAELFNKRDCNSLDFIQVKEIQKRFTGDYLRKRNCSKACNLAWDLIELNGAFSLLTAEGKESVVKLYYHSDDLMSQASLDWNFFIKNAAPYRNKTKVFKSKNGPDFRIV
ncbi:radical SAM protein [Treponema sp.]|uniref:B12-binding domain-containing radical SAM protein n=1 Tax=Treponema sp. TaxID=166 RepID=UPI0025E6D980|nr:B12-binding domain-containing radical SAM protein [Treponema sp.]MCR5218815.1 radical SAM protein [Treponema sp.]